VRAFRNGAVKGVGMMAFAMFGLSSPILASGTWGEGSPAEFATANTFSKFEAVSCSSAGNCTAVGKFYNADNGSEAFTMTSTNGVWGQATPAVFASDVQSAVPDTQFTVVSCASAGNCTAAGHFKPVTGGRMAFTMTSTNGVWGQAVPVPFEPEVQSISPYSSVNSVSCASVGNCTAVGYFKNANGGYEAFTWTMSGGQGGQAAPAVFADGVEQSPTYRNASFYGVSCASAGNCAAVGYFSNESNNVEALTMMSAGGVWGRATPAAFASGVQNAAPSATFYAVSCTSVGNCTAVGYFKNTSGANEALTMTSSGGEWGQASTAMFATGVRSANPEERLSSVSCASAGNCTSAGYFKNADSVRQLFTLTSSGGAWGQGTPVVFASGLESSYPYSDIKAVSCGSAGNCTAVGEFRNAANNTEAFTVTSTGGVWGQPTPVVFGTGIQNESQYAVLTSVSCASAGDCTAVGQFKNASSNYEAFTLTQVNNTPAETTTTTTTPGNSAETTTTVVSTTPTTVAPPDESVVAALPVASTPLVADNSISAGAEVSVTFGGFVPGEFVQLIVASTPQVIGSGYADAQGVVTLSGNIPASLTSGDHTLAVYAPGSGTGFKQPITVSGLALPATGSRSDGWLVAGLFTVIAGTVLSTRRRRIS
jgi:LPXTG-motif cell wall-anchored protein